MKSVTRTGIAALALWATAPIAPAQVGDPLPEVRLANFTATQAGALEHYAGRLLLIEFFAYW